ncbi:MAG TPA: peptide-methionine (S)-S-oxide reductase MsrA [Gemmatimonadales bacterium]
MSPHVPALLVSLVALLAPGGAPAPAAASKTAVLAGGCFWGVEAVFEHVRGVKSVTSGYATPDGNGRKGFAEAVRIVYDPAQVRYEQLLAVFFLVAHDLTQVDRQGPDVGPRYRSIVFVADDGERRIVGGYLDSLRTHGTFTTPIATEIVPLRSFRIAEDFHQDYAEHHPQAAYVVVNDLPKLAALRRRFPALYRQ